MRPDLRRETPGHFAHGRQKRQRGIRQLHGFVADSDHALLEHLPGEGFIGGQVQIGVDDLARLHPVHLGTEGFFDLDDHFGALPDVAGFRDDFGAGRRIRFVGDAAAEPGALFDHNAVVVGPERGHPGRHNGDAPFIRLDLFWYADTHKDSPPVSGRPFRAIRCNSPEFYSTSGVLFSRARNSV